MPFLLYFLLSNCFALSIIHNSKAEYYIELNIAGHMLMIRIIIYIILIFYIHKPNLIKLSLRTDYKLILV